jgi:hypothetical protein
MGLKMRTQSPDTTEEAELFQIAALRRKGEAGRFKLSRSLTTATRKANWYSVQQLHPLLSKQEAFLFFVSLHYGEAVAYEMRVFLEQRQHQQQIISEDRLMISDDAMDTLKQVVAVFGRIGVNYAIGGSVASSTHGIARSTADVDLVANFQAKHVALLLANLPTDFYVSETAIREALARKSSFNIIDPHTGLKVDVFILKSDPFSQASFARAKVSQINPDEPQEFRMDAPEDVLLHKLNWYKMGGSVSEKQWFDILGILKMQSDHFDVEYARQWALRLGVADLLTSALAESGM